MDTSDIPEKVSLPGGADDSERTVLEVLNGKLLNNNNTSEEQAKDSLVKEEETQKERVEAIEPSQVQAPETHNQIQTSENESDDKILDIESHLIETYEQYSISESSECGAVSIDELPPASEELAKPSLAESATSPKTVIEVEPAVPKVLKTVETVLSSQAPQSAAAAHEPEEDKRSHIESDTNNNCDTLEPCPTTKREEFRESSKTESEDLVADEDPPKTAESQQPVTKPDQISIDINGLPLPSTPQEEEEKQKFLDSIPQLEVRDDDSIAVSRRAKKEYYQSLRKYLVDEQDNKPPVPLQTYRWEDLRRAKEHGGYPWTHIYKRPLHSDEEPEIVLLLRKSQEFRFASESPKSLKKVRIDETVLVKETERYIEDLEEEEEENHDEPAEEEEDENTESCADEADAHSVQSEAISCVSDSVLTAKKKTSKLGALKGILKRSKASKDKEHDEVDNRSIQSEAISCKSESAVTNKKSSKLGKLKGILKRSKSADKESKLNGDEDAISVSVVSVADDDTRSLQSQSSAGKNRTKLAKLRGILKRRKSKDETVEAEVCNGNVSEKPEAELTQEPQLQQQSDPEPEPQEAHPEKKITKFEKFSKILKQKRSQEEPVVFAEKSVEEPAPAEPKTPAKKLSKFEKFQGLLKRKQTFPEESGTATFYTNSFDVDEEGDKSPVVFDKVGTHSLKSEKEETHNSLGDKVVEVKTAEEEEEEEKEVIVNGVVDVSVSEEVATAEEVTEDPTSEVSVSEEVGTAPTSEAEVSPEESKEVPTLEEKSTEVETTIELQAEQELQDCPIEVVQSGFVEEDNTTETPAEKLVEDRVEVSVKEEEEEDITVNENTEVQPASITEVSSSEEIYPTESVVSLDTPVEIELEEDSRSVHSEPAKETKIGKLKGILKRTKTKPEQPVAQPEEVAAEIPAEDTEEPSKPVDTEEEKPKSRYQIMDRIRNMADKQFRKRNIKNITLKKDEKIDLEEEQKIIRLKTSPKAQRSEIPHFIEKQDSDDILDIVELEESPSRKRKDHEAVEEESSVVEPDEIIELPAEEDKSEAAPPHKTPRLRREHVYEDIDDEELPEIIHMVSVDALKKSLAAQDQSVVQDLEASKTIPLDRMGSSEESVERAPMSHLAPLSSIDSASSEEDRRTQLSPVQEESDVASVDGLLTDRESAAVIQSIEEHEQEELLRVEEPERKTSLKREASPTPSEKKVTFSHVEDEAEPHREDIELPEEVLENAPNRWSNMTDHEYEPIGVPQESSDAQPSVSKEPSPAPKLEIPTPAQMQEELSEQEPTTPDPMQEAEELQRDLEERYFSSATTTPRTESRTDNEIHTSQVDSSALEELPLRAEDRKKSFMASAQDRSRKMQAGIRTQAGKIRTKIRGMKKPPRSPKGSPKAKERKRFKAPEFAKMKMPELKRPEMPKFKAPDMSKLKDFKRPEFTKFNKPDMSKFKIPEKFSSLKLTRSKSFKEPSEVTTTEDASEPTAEAKSTSPKKKFDFSSFGTYPRALRRSKTKQDSVEVNAPDELPSVVTTETVPSIESSGTAPIQSDRGPGPVRSRWADKFSDVSYGGSDTSRFQRFGSEQESFDRESSMERRMKDDLESAIKEEEELAIISGVEQKVFAEFDEENRAIHEISQFRAGEFRRRPLVHQDSDLVSEESKDIGWSEKDIIKNKILRKAEFDTEGYNLYPSEEGLSGSVNTNQETQSTASSFARKGVIEEIDDDEFFLRKRGISQDNIEIRQYISSAIREGFETPVNALSQLGTDEGSQDPVDYGYDVPPPKPRRVKHYNNFDSQEFEHDDNLSLPSADFYRNIPPSRPLRRGRKHSERSHVPDDAGSYFEEVHYEPKEQELDEGVPQVEVTAPPPRIPKRRRHSVRDSKSMEKDSFINGFGGRSVSNTFLQSDNQPENVIVYRTEHVIPLATPERFTEPISTPRKSRSHSHMDDDRTSRGADSLRSEAFNVEDDENDKENFTIEMTEHDGYAVVRKDMAIPKPTPPARRRRFTRSPGERFATMPHARKHSPPPLGEMPARNYNTIGPSKPPRRKASLSFDETHKTISNPDVSQYEELEFPEELRKRAESPRDLQSGDVVNKMKFRPLPAPPRPPRDRKSRDRFTSENQDDFDDKDDRDGGGERLAAEMEVSTQTDPLPDDFVCEDFEITDDMRIIEPRRTRTVEDILREEEEAELERVRQQIDEENLANGVYRFREANQRSYSEKSRASSQGALSRPQTPSAILIERRIPTPSRTGTEGIMLEASLTVQPLDDLELEEELLRREGLYEGSETKSEAESHEPKEEERLPDTEDESKPEGSQIASEIDEEEWEIQLRLAEERLRLEIPSEEEKLYESSTEPEPETEEAEPETEMSPPPVPPPRKRSSLAGLEDASRDQTLEKSLTPLVEQPRHHAVEATLPTRLAVADLEVERLRVHALQAGHIMVSELHGAQIFADDLQCNSGNLVVRNIELPPGFIEEIVERVRTSERDHAQIPVQTQTIEAGQRNEETQTVDDAPPIPPAPQTPTRPPPPAEYPESIPPASFYQLSSPDEPTLPRPPQIPSEYLQSIPPAAFFQLRSPDPIDEDFQPSPQTHRRRRHHRRRDSSSEDSRRHRSRSRPEDTSVVQAGRNLFSACNSSLARQMTALANYLRMNSKQEGDGNVGTLVAIFIFMTLGFLLLVLSGKDIHHHHWDFFNPPDNGGRP